MKIVINLISICLLVSCGNKLPSEDLTKDWQIKESEIVEITERPKVISGIVPPWIRIDIRTGENENLVLYYVYLDMEEKLPMIGEICTFEGWNGKIDGIVSDGSDIPLHPVYAINRFKCEPSQKKLYNKMKQLNKQ